MYGSMPNIHLTLILILLYVYDTSDIYTLSCVMDIQKIIITIGVRENV